MYQKAIRAPALCKRKVSILKATVARLLGCPVPAIRASIPFSRMFGGGKKVIALWEAIPELWERQIPVYQNWNILVLALEWQKAEVNVR